MRTRNVKLWAGLLALSLLLALLPGVSLAADSPVVTYTPGGEGTATVYVEGLDAGTGIYAVQLELTFAGTYPDAAFVAADTSAYQPGKKAVVSGGNTTLTVYVVNGDKPLNQGRILTLGTLDVGGDFVMPGSAKLSLLDESARPVTGADNATVTVSRHVGGVAVQPAPTPTPTPAPAGDLPFTDVRPEHWFYDAVKFAHENKLMSGMTATTFSPDTPTNRGMIVTILYRMEGSPAAGTPAFTDVPADKYYTKAIAWAVKNNIVSGYPNGTFAPESNITREQLAFILYRYAAYKGYSVTGRASLTGFSDTADVSAYAEDGLRWAISAGLVSGVTKTTLVPKGSATRAQAALILMRFCETVAK